MNGRVLIGDNLRKSTVKCFLFFLSPDSNLTPMADDYLLRDVVHYSDLPRVSTFAFFAGESEHTFTALWTIHF